LPEAEVKDLLKEVEAEKEQEAQQQQPGAAP